MTPFKLLAAGAFALIAFAPPPGIDAGAARAQILRPPGDVPDAIIAPAQADAAGAQLRIDRLENQIRSMTGQMEEMQFQIRRLEEQLRKFQQDVDFRFDEQKGAKPGARPAPSAPGAPATPRRSELRDNASPASPPVTARRGDAFDPALDPAAPGAPRDLATMAPGENAAPPPVRGRPAALPAGPLSTGEEAETGAPLDLTQKPVDPTATASLQGQAAPRVIAAPEAAPQVASLPQAAPANDYDLGNVAFRDGRYDVAEERFRAYLEQHPKERLTPEATFLLGETFFRRARPRDAAEQYLKITVDFPRAVRAPEALVKLGLSLEKLGAKEQACAAFGEVGRKYPAASSAVRTSAERESKRVQC